MEEKSSLFREGNKQAWKKSEKVWVSKHFSDNNDKVHDDDDDDDDDDDAQRLYCQDWHSKTTEG